MNITSYPGIYIHIPFCHSKCGYCDFYSDTNLQLVQKFLTALAIEIDQRNSVAESNTVFDTIYLGGGTPSLLNPNQIHKILEMLKKGFTFHENTEITIEVNPGTTNKDFFNQYISMGIGRLSIGVQSFCDDELRFLERIHNVTDAVSSIEQARIAGYNNINIDLIYAFPGQTFNSWEYSLKTLMKFSPEHVSAYNLSIENGTPFHAMLTSGKIIKLSEKKEADFYVKSHRFLTDLNYFHYEVSNFARTPEYISRHNYKYWNHTPYLSFGPSAHSFWHNKRWKNVRSISEYISQLSENGSAIDQSEELSEQQLIFESVFLSLRTAAGINLHMFKENYGKDFLSMYAAQIDPLLKSGHAIVNNEKFALTQKGMLVCDEISTKFII